MDDPREAARALREYASQHGWLGVARTERPANALNDKPKPPDDLGIHLPSGQALVLEDGIDARLAKKLERSATAADDGELVVCIIDFTRQPNLDEVIQILEDGSRVLMPLGRRGIIVRLDKRVVKVLASRPYVRAVAEYRPDLKYPQNPSMSRRPGAFVYTFDGDKPAYRADLARSGVVVSWWNDVVGCYGVELSVERFPAIASLVGQTHSERTRGRE
jgi:hypothetical protein